MILKYLVTFSERKTFEIDVKIAAPLLIDLLASGEKRIKNKILFGREKN